MKTLLTARFFILSLFFVIACKKNDTAPPAAQKTLLTKADYQAVGVFTYTYDANNRLLTEVYGGNASNPAYTTTITNYDGQGRVTEYVTDYVSAIYTDEKGVVSYNANGKIERVLYFGVNGGPLNSYIAFEYPANKSVRKFYSNSNTLLNFSESTYSADGKNVIETKQYNGASTNTSTQAYSNFDTKKSNDFLFPVGYIAFATNENNYQNISNTNHITSVVTSSTFTYEYNNDGYVTKRTSGTGSVNLFEYIKK